MDRIDAIPEDGAVDSTAADKKKADDEKEEGTEDASKRRHRRTFAELDRKFYCTFPDCNRPYATEHSLQQHIRLKHASSPSCRRRNRAISVPIRHGSLAEAIHDLTSHPHSMRARAPTVTSPNMSHMYNSPQITRAAPYHQKTTLASALAHQNQPTLNSCLAEQHNLNVMSTSITRNMSAPQLPDLSDVHGLSLPTSTPPIARSANFNMLQHPQTHQQQVQSPMQDKGLAATYLGLQAQSPVLNMNLKHSLSYVPPGSSQMGGSLSQHSVPGSRNVDFSDLPSYKFEPAPMMSMQMRDDSPSFNANRQRQWPYNGLRNMNSCPGGVLNTNNVFDTIQYTGVNDLHSFVANNMSNQTGSLGRGLDNKPIYSNNHTPRCSGAPGIAIGMNSNPNAMNNNQMNNQMNSNQVNNYNQANNNRAGYNIDELSGSMSELGISGNASMNTDVNANIGNMYVHNTMHGLDSLINTAATNNNSNNNNNNQHHGGRVLPVSTMDPQSDIQDQKGVASDSLLAFINQMKKI